MPRPSNSARLRTWRQLAAAGLVTAGLLASAHGAVRAQPSGIGARTYTLGGAAIGTLNDPLWYAAKYGGFTDPNATGPYTPPARTVDDEP